MEALSYGELVRKNNWIELKGIANHEPILKSLHKCIPPMTSYLFINDICPEFAELLATRPFTSYEFYSTGMDCLNKFFW